LPRVLYAASLFEISPMPFIEALRLARAEEA
jgi:hypothetical protein